ncbi:hypothetical protein [Nocardia acidivorans]|uniref:hypothetical protein n=1 Tax=Nocardia acidivorans TaxID=404580 RepID=UPI000B0130F8|nr:hypothetical protein [Nocardia acidivorans]
MLAVIAGVSPALRNPFTLPIAKQSTPRELWDHPGFIRTSYVITSVWAASFAIGCVALALLAHLGAAHHRTDRRLRDSDGLHHPLRGLRSGQGRETG